MGENIFILFVDHGQDSLVENEERAKLNLHELYSKWNIASFTEKPSTGDLVISNNHRSAYIYPINKDITMNDLTNTSLQDRRMDIVATTHQDGWTEVWSTEYNEPFRFKEGGEWTDIYDQSWSIEGEHNVLKLDMSEQEKMINYSDYPDALLQLQSSLRSQPGSIIVTAKPGFVVFSETAPVHNGGGEHGGLHKNDTVAALIIAGTDEMPTYRRIVDLKEYILTLLKN